MKFLPPSVLLFLISAFASAAEPSVSPLDGSWHFEPERSTELSPWKDYELTIAVKGTEVTFQRKLAWSRRAYSDEYTIDTAKAPTVVPVEMWPENRHLGAYIADDHSKRVAGVWLDGGRILRLSTDLTLSTQQGDRPVNILSDYKVSANGAVLTLIELRSTRNRPIVYVFTRVHAAKK